MSYILEALKKAQAERQIGSTPTIHAPTLASVPVGQGARSKRTPVIVAMALMAAAIAGLATMLVRQQPAGVPPAAASAPAGAVRAATVPAVAAMAAPAPSTVANPADAAPIPASASPASTATVTPAPGSATPAAAPAPATTAATPAPATGAINAPAAPAVAAAARRTADAQIAAPPAVPNASRTADAPQQAATKQAGNAVRGADTAQAAPVPAPAQAEEQVQSLRELPEPIQRAIPQITLGGYMYSKNPADRLLLIDKVLRREGEEVAPGLMLDKLQPKQAIFSFRGYRYRVPL